MNKSEIAITPGWEDVLAANSLDSYDAVMTTDRGVKLVKPGLGSRQRIRMTLNRGDGSEITVFLKRYGNTGPEIIEHAAVELIRSIGIDTMENICCGIGPRGGFIMVTKVPGEAISDCFDTLLERYGEDVQLLNAQLAVQLGEMAAKLHAADLVHKDFYATHIFIDMQNDKLLLNLIDLARVTSVKFRKWKWFVKDLSGLHFSMPKNWVEKNWRTFLDSYERNRAIKVPLWVRWWILWRSARTQKSFNRRMRRSGKSN